MKLLSIIIPVYNAASTIERTIQSINQLCPESKNHCEIIFVNDGSKDNGAEIIQSKRNDLFPIEIKFLTQKNTGSGGARNLGLKNSCGEWVFFLDADDELSFDPVPYIQNNSSFTALLFSVAVHKNLKHKVTLQAPLVTTENHFDTFINQKFPFAVSSILFKKQNIKSFFNTEFLYLEDSLFWVMNPLIFGNTKFFTETISSIIHTHKESKTANITIHGKYRKKYACEILKTFSNSLTKKQKNNLHLQSMIGLIQQRRKIPLSSFLLFPCNLILYLKFFLYFIFDGDFGKLNFYSDK